MKWLDMGPTHQWASSHTLSNGPWVKPGRRPQIHFGSTWPFWGTEFCKRKLQMTGLRVISWVLVEWVCIILKPGDLEDRWDGRSGSLQKEQVARFRTFSCSALSSSAYGVIRTFRNITFRIFNLLTNAHHFKNIDTISLYLSTSKNKGRFKV